MPEEFFRPQIGHRQRTFNDIALSPTKGSILSSPKTRVIGRFLSIFAQETPEWQFQRDMAGDIFQALADWESVLRHEDETVESRKFNREVMKWLMESGGLMHTRAQVSGSIPAKVAATQMLYELVNMDETIQEAMQDWKDAEQEKQNGDQLEQEMGQGEGDGDSEGEGESGEGDQDGDGEGDGEGDQDSQGQDQRQQQLDQHRQNEKNLRQKALAKLKALQQSQTGKVKAQSMMEQAGEAGQEIEAEMEGWGFEPGEVTHHDNVAEMLEMMKNLSEVARTIGKMVGRLKGVAASSIISARESDVGPITEATMTEDYTKLFPEEMMRLSPDAPPFMRGEAISEFFDGGLLGWQTRMEGSERGAFIAMLDESSSMVDVSAEVKGIRFYPVQIAKAVAVGIAQALREDSGGTSRQYYEMWGFESTVDRDSKLTSEDGGPAHINFAMRGAGGGTNFSNVFRHVIKRLKYLRDELKIEHADFLLLTDGESEVSDDVRDRWLKIKEQTGARLFLVEIPSSGAGVLMEERQAMRDLSDMYIVLDNIAEFVRNPEEAAQRIASAIVSTEIENRED